MDFRERLWHCSRAMGGLCLRAISHHWRKDLGARIIPVTYYSPRGSAGPVLRHVRQDRQECGLGAAVMRNAVPAAWSWATGFLPPFQPHSQVCKAVELANNPHLLIPSFSLQHRAKDRSGRSSPGPRNASSISVNSHLTPPCSSSAPCPAISRHMPALYIIRVSAPLLCPFCLTWLP